MVLGAGAPGSVFLTSGLSCGLKGSANPGSVCRQGQGAGCCLRGWRLGVSRAP